MQDTEQLSILHVEAMVKHIQPGMLVILQWYWHDCLKLELVVVLLQFVSPMSKSSGVFAQHVAAGQEAWHTPYAAWQQAYVAACC